MFNFWVSFNKKFSLMNKILYDNNFTSIIDIYFYETFSTSNLF
jgi:hypothetical protein